MANPSDLYFEVLNIPKNSSPHQIRAAYKALVKKWHPDKHPPASRPEAEAKFKAISQAYEALNDQQENRAMLGVCNEDNAEKKMHGVPVDGLCVSKQRTGCVVAKKAAAEERKLVCSLEELLFGCNKEVKFSRDVINKNGFIVRREETQTIKVQPGWKKGTKITFKEMGDERPGYLPADVIYVVSEKQHPTFKRVGDDLVLKVEIPLVNALTGWKFSFRLLGGEKMRYSFSDKVIYPGYEKVVKGQGMPLAHGKGARGDLRIKFDIIFPTQLSEEQRSGIKELLKGST